MTDQRPPGVMTDDEIASEIRSLSERLENLRYEKRKRRWSAEQEAHSR